MTTGVFLTQKLVYFYSWLVYNSLMMNEKGFAMKGSIRVLVGLLIAFGAVGTLDFDPSASVLVQGGIALVGCLVMLSGVRAMKDV